MNQKIKDKITPTQTAIAVSQMILGAGILTLSRGVSDAAGTPDGWLSVILSGIITLFIGVVLVALSMKFPDQTFYLYTPKIVGKYLGNFFGLIFVIYCLGVAAYVCRILGEVLHTFIMNRTPIEVLIASLMIVGCYLVVGGINPIVRIFELFFPAILFIFFIIILLNVQNFEIDKIKPLFGDGVMPIIKGLEPSIYSYVGVEAMLILTAFMKQKKYAYKAMAIGVSVPIFFYMILMIMSVGVLTVPELKTLTWPTLALAREIEFQGSFFERFESLFIVVWTIAVFTTFVSGYFYGALGVSQIFKVKRHLINYLLLPIMFLIAMYPQDLNDVFKFGDYLGYSAIGLVGFIPALLLVITKLRGLPNEKE